MVRSTRRAHVVSRGTARRKLVWATREFVLAGINAGVSTTVDLLSDFRGAGGDTLGCTIMRTHGYLWWQPVAILTDKTAFGLVIGRQQDVGTNNLNPSTGSNPEIDWMLDTRVVPTGTDLTTTQKSYTIDNRAKRKMEELGQAYLLVIGNSNGGAGAQVFSGFFRTLVALA